MNEISLQQYLKRFPSLATVVFPTEEERIISAAELKQSIMYEDVEASPENVATTKFFDQYIDEIDSRKEGKH